MSGETADRHPGEHARPGSPPGWYADPVKGHSLRRWDGAHWTADVDPPAAVAEFQPSAKRHAFNWPLLVVAILVPAWYAVAVIVLFATWPGSDPQPSWARVLEAFLIPIFFSSYFVVPPIVFLLGLLGTRRRYSTASRIAAVVPLLIGGLVSINNFQDWISGTDLNPI
jgi:hypothetical protein